LSFALIHILNNGFLAARVINVVSVFFVSLLLGKARNRSGGLLLPMVMHAVINFISHSVLVPVA
jgi:membrane protease YdiL (CAAX protease family)